MINELKNSAKEGLSDAWESVSSKMPSGVLFWSALGAVVVSGAVYFIKPVRHSLRRLLGLSKSRKALKNPAKHRVRMVSRRRLHTKTSGRLAHAVRVR